MNRHHFKFTLGLKVIQEQRTDYKDACMSTARS